VWDNKEANANLRFVWEGARVSSRRRHLIGWLLVISLLAVALTFAVSKLGTGPRFGEEVSPDRVCQRQLEALGKATVDYRRKHGDLPQSIMGPEGHKHSWRTLLVATLLARSGVQKTVDYRFDEPWDSAGNRGSVRNSTLSCRCTCPLENNIIGHPFISYVMLVRPANKAAREGRLGEATLPDDAVLIVESANCRIEYAEPKDLEWNALWEGESPFGVGKLNSLHPGVVKAVRVDGKVIDIPKSLGRDELKKLLNGNQVSN
jgi:hypothetical protein